MNASRLARAAFMHHDDNGYNALKYYAVLQGIYKCILVYIDMCDACNRTWCVTCWVYTHRAGIHTAVYTCRPLGQLR